MRLVRIDTLQPGACLAHDVSWGQTQVPQLRAGVTLTDYYLERLHDVGVHEVYVFDPADASDATPEIVHALTRIENAEALAPEPASAPALAAEARRPAKGRSAGRLSRIAHALRGVGAVGGLRGA
jgi:hypothetical protein